MAGLFAAVVVLAFADAWLIVVGAGRDVEHVDQQHVDERHPLEH